MWLAQHTGLEARHQNSIRLDGPCKVWEVMHSLMWETRGSNVKQCRAYQQRLVHQQQHADKAVQATAGLMDLHHPDRQFDEDGGPWQADIPRGKQTASAPDQGEAATHRGVLPALLRALDRRCSRAPTPAEWFPGRQQHEGGQTVCRGCATPAGSLLISRDASCTPTLVISLPFSKHSILVRKGLAPRSTTTSLRTSYCCPSMGSPSLKISQNRRIRRVMCTPFICRGAGCEREANSGAKQGTKDWVTGVHAQGHVHAHRLPQRTSVRFGDDFGAKLRAQGIHMRHRTPAGNSRCAT